MSDCYLSHDWDDNRNRGFSTNACPLNVPGNLVGNLTAVLDSAKSVLIFLTAHYVHLVERSEFSICQLEFNRSLRSHPNRICFVVLDAVLLSRLGDGVVGMAVRSNPCVDCTNQNSFQMCTDQLAAIFRSIIYHNADSITTSAIRPFDLSHVSSPSMNVVSPVTYLVPSAHRGTYATSLPAIQVLASSPLHGASTLLKTGDAANLSNSGSPLRVPEVSIGTNAVADSTADSVALDALTINQLEQLLDKLNLAQYKDAILRVQASSADWLSSVSTLQQLVEVGVSVLPKARLLLARIQQFKLYGVPMDLLGIREEQILTSPLCARKLMSDSLSSSPAKPVTVELSSSKPKGPVIGTGTGTGLFAVGTEVEAKPKRVDNKPNYRYHRAFIQSVNRDGTYDVQLKSSGEVCASLPLFAVCSLQAIEQKEQQRLVEKGGDATAPLQQQQAVESADSSSLGVSRGAVAVSLPHMRIPRTLGNDPTDVQLLVKMVKPLSG